MRLRAWLARCLIVALCLPGLSGCTSLVRANEASVRLLVEDFIAAVNAADTERFLAFFATDATAFFPSNASAARRRGVEQIRAAVAPVFALGPRAPAARLTDLVITAQADLAVASFDAGSGALHARRTLVLERIAGRWYIVHLHASNVAESPGP
jgi:uncharacterized protein (TIGR02246 family)